MKLVPIVGLWPPFTELVHSTGIYAIANETLSQPSFADETGEISEIAGEALQMPSLSGESLVR